MKINKGVLTVIILETISIITMIIRETSDLIITNFTLWSILYGIEKITEISAFIIFGIIIIKYIKSKKEQERQDQVNIIAEAIKKAQTEEK